MNSRAGEEFKMQQQSSDHLGSLSSPHRLFIFRKVRSHLLERQDQFCWSRDPLIDLPFSKRGEKMIMTMTILPLMYSHPSIKDTLPQRSVIASQSQLCLDNPSSKCTECLTVPRTGRDCPQRAVWRKENSLSLVPVMAAMDLLKCLSFQQLSLTSKLFFCLSLMFIPKVTQHLQCADV